MFSACAQVGVYGLMALLQLDSLDRASVTGGGYLWRTVALSFVGLCLLAFGVLQLWFTVKRLRLEGKVVRVTS